nr:hypothetical protein [Candidatus Freyrarchaeum guaymaensis]
MPLRRRIMAMLRYEVEAFTRSLPVTLTLTLVVSGVLTLLYLGGATAGLQSSISDIVSGIISGQAGFMFIYGDFFSVLNSLTFLPDPLRSYVALVFTVRRELATSSFYLEYMLPMLVIPIVSFTMFRTSLVREEEIYVLVRVDRNMLLVVRSLVSALLYSLVALAVVYALKLYATANPVLSLIKPVIECLTPLTPLLPSFFLFLLLVQGAASLINVYAKRITYFIPIILFLDLLIAQTFITATSSIAVTVNISSLIQASLVSGGLNILGNQQVLTSILYSAASVRGTTALVQYLPLYQFSMLLHALNTRIFGGIWHPGVFDPAYALQEAFFTLPSSVLIGKIYSLFLPQAITLLLIVESVAKPLYNPWATILYMIPPTIVFFSLAIILFGRKTL